MEKSSEVSSSSTITSTSKNSKYYQKIGFSTARQFSGFLSVVVSGQIIYSAFEAFKGTFYELLLQVLNVNNAQLGVLFSLIGTSIFFYIPGGWINNRFSVRSIIVVSLIIRFATVLVMVFANPSFNVLKIIAFIWGVVEAVFWPAVLNGVDMLSDPNYKGMAYGLLESIRRALEVFMNLLLVGIMSLIGGIVVFKGGMFVYNLLILPLCVWIWKTVPKNGISDEKNTDQSAKSLDALKGLFKVLSMPKIWLAALIALTIYWSYINLIYTVPYLQTVFHVNQALASLFGIITTGVMGIISGAIAGIVADYVFHSTAKTIFIALSLTAVGLIGVLVVPKTADMIWMNVAMILLFSFSIFLAKSLFMVPITEADVPDKYSGSAMSIGSFAGYAPVFWAYSMNGSLIDNNSAVSAYTKIFQIGSIVVLVGVAASFALVLVNRKRDKAKWKEKLAKKAVKND